eukprot:TRINITY_DN7870_c0_g5_i1.p1 TRINITY_DN7870_c0_g5~~TRINITY_DN7870_c0_g5_i1.p1  ORF type:complete len:341 (+),score=73.75 TRINITY_DN7870_c0_g5_i1:73-1023(+)
MYEGGGQTKLAVKDLCLAIPSGQCFGFLGINGAGKTTTMSMLTGDIRPTTGSAKINQYDIISQLLNVRQEVGYCPQFDPLLEQMTARETLCFYASLRGIPQERIPLLVESLLERLSLTPHADRPCGGYSGGNKRKLSLGMALVGSPSTVFLDEPSTGMDPKARRFMWSVIQEIASQHSVVLTTHSMEECEATCSRLGIMVSGRLAVLGTPQHLKSKYGTGYFMEVKTTEENVSAVREFIERVLVGAQLEELHGGRLKYRIPQRGLSLSAIFSELEQNKAELHIEDYSISQSTLEQIFLSIAKKQQEEKGPIDGLVS